MVGIGQDVAVAVDGGLNWGVAKLKLDEFDILVLGNKKSRVGVAQIVKADFAKPCAHKGGFEFPFYKVWWIDGIACFIAKD